MNNAPVENVWDYPRPPRLEPTPRQIRIVHGGRILASTTRALRILETSHPPVYYIPPADIDMAQLTPTRGGQSFCEFKGFATYWSLGAAANVAWSYPEPTAAYAALAHHLAFYASKVDECWVDEERVIPQAGDFYGGWITSDLRGPFKGAPGTRHW